jgi:hypothetical protein
MGMLSRNVAAGYRSAVDWSSTSILLVDRTLAAKSSNNIRAAAVFDLYFSEVFVLPNMASVPQSRRTIAIPRLPTKSQGQHTTPTRRRVARACTAVRNSHGAQDPIDSDVH